jgi:thiamine kinase-like enzyme
MMLLTPYNSIPYLLHNEHKLISFEDILEDKYYAHYQQGFSRNTTIVIDSDDSNKQRYFLKQPRYFEEKNIETLVIEAIIYSYFEDNSEINILLPKFFFYDEVNIILGVECLNPLYGFIDTFSITKTQKIINEDSLKLENQGIQMSILAALTLKILKSHEGFNRKNIETKTRNAWIFDKGFKPTLLTFTDNDRKKVLMSKESEIVQLGEFINEEKVIRSLVSLQWENSCLIHGDIKLDNLIYIENDVNKLKIVDWEFAAFGDYRWDAAGLIKEFWKKWEPSNSRFSDLYKYRIGLTNAFLENYLDIAHSNFKEETNIILKMVGVHLLTLLFESISIFKIEKDGLNEVLKDVRQLICDSESVLN